MIKKEELPLEVGLVWYYPETQKVVTKRKAVRRKTSADMTDMYKYILYSAIDPDRIPFYNDRAEYAKAYLENKNDKKYLGLKFGTKLACELEEAKKELERVSDNIEQLNFLERLMSLLVEKEVVPSYLWQAEPWRRYQKIDYDHLLRLVNDRLSKEYPEDLYRISRQIKRISNSLDLVLSKNDEQGGEN